MDDAAKYTFIKLDIVERSPNYVYITADDLPELNLWGPPSEVIPAIVPAIKRLFKLNNNVDVEVIPVPAAKNFPKQSEEELPTRYVLSRAA